MCGIAGVISARDPQPEVRAMLDRLSHRGPDGQGLVKVNHGGNTVCFGHRRLSIIDIENGAQPMQTAGGDETITFNGEIFNFLDLAKALRDGGADLRSRSDTEVLLLFVREAFRGVSGRSGRVESSLRSLNGMFAFAYWDAPSGTLLLARDRFGIKPLYYACLKDGGIAFASELAALLELPDSLLDKTINVQGLADFFFHDYIPPPATIITGIRKLEIGEYLLWRKGAPLTTACYWRHGDIPVNRNVALPEGERALGEELVDLLSRSVRRQLISDVPVGIFLSGGIDSSLITAIAARVCEQPLKTYSIGFKEKSFDESSASRLVASVLGAQHQEKIVDEATIFADLDATLDCMDEPFGDASVLPTYQVAKLARQEVKVCLGGDGADELWGGYPFYSAHRYAGWYGRIPRVIRSGIIRPLVRALPVRETYQPLEWKAKRFVNRWGRDDMARHFRFLAGTDYEELAGLSRHRLPVPTLLRQEGAGSGMASLEDYLRLDLTSYLPGSVLTKVDRATMSQGLEARPPFLDNEIVEFSLRQPIGMKLAGNVTKYLLREIAKGLLPANIAGRRKQGFSVPISRWTRTLLRQRLDNLLEDSVLLKSGLMDRPALLRAFDEHCSRQVEWGKFFWSFLVFEHWYENNKEKLRIE